MSVLLPDAQEMQKNVVTSFCHFVHFFPSRQVGDGAARPRITLKIRSTAGSFVKNLHNEKTLESTGTVRVSRPYPLPYGFILNTTSDDGLNVDCFILTKTSLLTGQIVECDPVGLMEQFENGKEDHNVLAISRGEESNLDIKTKQMLTDFVSHVCDHISGKTILAGRFLETQAAMDYIARHLDPQMKYD